MLDLLLSLVLAVHLVCMNVASAGPLVCVWLDWRGGNGNEVAYRAARFLAWKSLVLLVIGTIFGVLVAAFVWNDAYHDLMHTFMYKIIWGGWEWLFSIVMGLLYAVLVARGAARGTASKIGRASIAILSATNLFYHFPVLFIMISEAAGGYLEVPAKIDAVNFRSLMTDNSVIARSMHFVVASFAVTGVSLIGYGKRLLRDEERKEAGSRIAVWGARIALVPTLLQIVVGVWVLSVLPPSMQRSLMGGELLAASAFGLSIVGALWLMQQLSAVAFGDTQPRTLTLAIHLMYAVVILMTLTTRLASARPLPSASSAAMEMSDGH